MLTRSMKKSMISSSASTNDSSRSPSTASGPTHRQTSTTSRELRVYKGFKGTSWLQGLLNIEEEARKVCCSLLLRRQQKKSWLQGGRPWGRQRTWVRARSSIPRWTWVLAEVQHQLRAFNIMLASQTTSLWSPHPKRPSSSNCQAFPRTGWTFWSKRTDSQVYQRRSLSRSTGSNSR